MTDDGKPKVLRIKLGDEAYDTDNLEAMLAADCGTFQLHYSPLSRTLMLYRVEIRPDGARCPVIVHGERCGDEAGHEGKHQWGRGD